MRHESLFTNHKRLNMVFKIFSRAVRSRLVAIFLVYLVPLQSLSCCMGWSILSSTFAIYIEETLRNPVVSVAA